ncbi:hypothetical protein CRYUN_Cryun05aG0004800 [Craigia yunnanensis]
MENHVSNSISSEQPLFETVEAIINYVASFLLDFEENPIVDEEAINEYVNSLLADFEENPHEQQGLVMFRIENHVSNPTSSDRPFSTLDEEMKFVGSVLVVLKKIPKKVF